MTPVCTTQVMLIEWMIWFQLNGPVVIQYLLIELNIHVHQHQCIVRMHFSVLWVERARYFVVLCCFLLVVQVDADFVRFEVWRRFKVSISYVFLDTQG